MSADQPDHAEASRRFARIALDAFIRAGRVTDVEVAAAGGPSDSYMTLLRRAAHEGAWLTAMRRSTQKKIEAAANWAPGSAQRVWDGGEPELSTPATAAGEMSTEKRAQAVEEALSQLEVAVQSLEKAQRELREELEHLRPKAEPGNDDSKGNLTVLGRDVHQQMSAAARLAESEGQKARAAQDAAGEESQEPGGDDV